MADQPTAPSAAASIADLALQRKLVTPEQYEQCKTLARKSSRMGLETTTDEVFLKQGLLSEDQVQELRHIAELGDGGEVFGAYRLNQMIGQGGMGKVYAAVHETMNRTVALKVIHYELTKDKTSASRFFLEIRALAKLNHPSVVTIYDCGRVGKRYFFAMEYVSDGSLKDLVEKRAVLSDREALLLVRRIAEGLAHAHASDIIHRDVKPENVLIDQNGRPKLTDFGLVMHRDADHMSLTQSGMMVGSYYYMAPEQMDGARDIDHRADIYSLGATLYFALTGKVPFPGKTPQEIIAQTLTGTYVSPRHYNHTVRGRTLRLLRSMMAKNRDKRLSSMSQVIDAIDHTLKPNPWKRRFLLALGGILLFAAGMLIERVVGLVDRLW